MRASFQSAYGKLKIDARDEGGQQLFIGVLDGEGDVKGEVQITDTHSIEEFFDRVYRLGLFMGWKPK